MCFINALKIIILSRSLCFTFAGLAWSMDENSLREAFVKYGEVVEGTLHSLHFANSNLEFCFPCITDRLIST